MNGIENVVPSVDEEELMQKYIFEVKKLTEEDLYNMTEQEQEELFLECQKYVEDMRKYAENMRNEVLKKAKLNIEDNNDEKLKIISENSNDFFINQLYRDDFSRHGGFNTGGINFFSENEIKNEILYRTGAEYHITMSYRPIIEVPSNITINDLTGLLDANDIKVVANSDGTGDIL